MLDIQVLASPGVDSHLDDTPWGLGVEILVAVVVFGPSCSGGGELSVLAPLVLVVGGLSLPAVSVVVTHFRRINFGEGHA